MLGERGAMVAEALVATHLHQSAAAVAAAAQSAAAEGKEIEKLTVPAAS